MLAACLQLVSRGPVSLAQPSARSMQRPYRHRRRVRRQSMRCTKCASYLKISLDGHGETPIWCPNKIAYRHGDILENSLDRERLLIRVYLRGRVGISGDRNHGRSIRAICDTINPHPLPTKAEG